MSADPNAYIAEVPCPKCGSKRAVWTPDGREDYECRDCGVAFDLPWGVTRRAEDPAFY